MGHFDPLPQFCLPHIVHWAEPFRALLLGEVPLEALLED